MALKLPGRRGHARTVICIAYYNDDCMARQLVVRVSDDLARQLDELIADGTVRSRSEAVRIGLADLLEARRRRKIGEAIVDGYRRVPPDDELDGVAEALARSMIAEEPW